ncbi:MAG TPA: peptide ABC transporter substrate-binding protein [Chloroflexota bacterium]|nr:peptide ABC transporter substrate-binding protein [Chloroflexota bacterium]
MSIRVRLLMLLVATALLGCTQVGPPSRAGEGPAPGAPPEKRIVYGVSQPIDIRPNANPVGRNYVQALIASPLTSRDGMGGRQPVLTTEVPSVENGRWQVNPDGTMVTTFALRPGALWHDGAPVTADDFVFSIEVGRDRGLPAFGAPAFASISDASAPDPLTFVVSWKEPFAGADALFSIDLGYPTPLPRHLLADAAATNADGFLDLPYWNEEFVGTGPFKLASWDPGVGMRLRAHDGYALGRPKIDRIDVQVIPDANTLVANLLAGSVDVTPDLGTVDAGTQLRDQWRDGTVEFNLGAGTWSQMVSQFLDPTPAAMRDVRFRTALATAIDRQAIVDSVVGGLSPVPLSLLDPNQPQYASLEASLPRFAYDPAQAVQILLDAGYRRSGDGTFRDSDGQAISLEVRSSTQAVLGKAATAIADDWQRVGLPARPVPTPPQLVNDRSYTSTFPAVWIKNGPTDVYGFRGFTSAAAPLASKNFVAPSPTNSGRYMNPELDDLIVTYFRTVPVNERVEVIGRIVHILTDQVVTLGLWYAVIPGASANRLSGVPPQWPSNAMCWNSWDWDVRG